VILGSNQPIPENVLQKALYLGVKVNTDPEMQPRQVITSSLFAMRAGVAETVVKGAINSDSLTAGSVTMEKVADGAIGSSKLAASAVTDTNLSPNAVTGDKILNGTVTKEKLSDDLLWKLAQIGRMPSDDSDLLVQSAGNNKNTLINANGDTGKVGVGTMDPKAKLDVQGPVKLSPTAQTEFTDSFWKNFGIGLLMFYNMNSNTGEIHSLNLAGGGGYSDLSLNGKNIFLNEKQAVGLPTPTGNVGIGLLSGTPLKNKLDVAGSVAIGSSYAGVNTAPADGLIVQGNTGIGTPTPNGKFQVDGLTILNGGTSTEVTSMIASFVDNQYVKGAKSDVKLLVNGGIAINSNDNLHIGPWDLWQDGGGSVASHLYIDRWTGNGSSSWREHMCWFEWDYTFHCRSDKRFKKDVKPLENSLDKVSKLQGVSYLPDTESSENVVGANKKIGFIAQDVEAVLPEVVSTDDKGYKGLAYDRITAVLVEAVKELKAQNDALKAIVCKDHPQEAICR